MLRLAGAFMITASCGIWGIKKSDSLKKRAKEAEKMIGALSILENEITYAKRDIKTVLASIGDTQNLQIFKVAARNIEQMSIEEAFDAAMEKGAGNLLSADIEVIKTMVRDLGRTDTKSQLKSISYAKNRFRDIKSEAEQEYNTSGKLYRSLGVLFGAMVSVILL